MKRSSLVLLLAGIGLIIAGCLALVQPLAQVFGHADPDPVQRLTLPPSGEAAGLAAGEALTVVPVLRVELPVAAAEATAETPRYTFSIRDQAGEVLIDTDGAPVFEQAAPDAGGPAAPVQRLRFRRITIPAGQWAVRFDAPAGAAPGGAGIQKVELLLLPPSPSLMAALTTALALAILGWLAAALGMVQWIRAEAARPAADGAPAASSGDPVHAWAVGCHLSGLLGYLLPFGHLLGPLAVWLSKRHRSAMVEEAGRNALNFQLSITIYVLVGLLLCFFLIGVAVLFLLVVFHVAAVLYAALRAQRGLAVVYPLSLRFI